MTDAEAELLLKYVRALRQWARNNQELAVKHVDCGCGITCEACWPALDAHLKSTPSTPPELQDLLGPTQALTII